jgi:anti-anti-sigma regulatory factor
MDVARRSAGPVTVDLEGLAFAGIAGVRVLAGLAEWCVAEARPFRFTDVPRTVGRVIRAGGHGWLVEPPRR